MEVATVIVLFNKDAVPVGGISVSILVNFLGGHELGNVLKCDPSVGHACNSAGVSCRRLNADT